LFSILLVFGLSAQEQGFVPNAGQWKGNFDFRLHQPEGYVYLKAAEQRVVLLDKPEHDHHEHHQDQGPLKGHVYNMSWIGADTNARISKAVFKGQPKLNYLLGKDPKYWKSGLSQYHEVIYHDLYPNIDLRYYIGSYGLLSFDFIVHPGGDPESIQWEIEGVEEQGLLSGNLTLITSLGSAEYTAPESFQNGEPVASSFRQIKVGVYGFKVGDYNRKEKLIIDPTLVFSTYSGSLDDNFGFSATYGEDGSGYGAGINYGYGQIWRGYPTTLGAFQDSSQGGRVDATISKYTADGTAMIYGTYLGGLGNDVPFSLLEGPNKSLIVLGVTGSIDFPVTANGFDTSFAEGPKDTMIIGGSLDLNRGSQIFLSILDSTGGALIGSTFFGDSLGDGHNKRLIYNYGDAARGDITLDNQGNIIVSSYTMNANLPTGLATNSSHQGAQDGLVLSFNADLSSLNWASYIGGEDQDACISLRYTNTGRLFVTGATKSDNIPYPKTNAYQETRQGGIDAFVAEINPADGNVLKFTYSGTPDDDLSFFVDYTPAGDLVIFGQTNGIWPMVGTNVWGQDSSSQFLQEFSPDLSSLLHSTSFGTGKRSEVNISPTALMVSDCGDIFISGWGASYNNPNTQLGTMGYPAGMPLTPDAYRSNFDLLSRTNDTLGDFYFMRLDASWQRLTYGTYFGMLGGSDHVDGGSSRFRRDGSIFQAVCSCGASTFPITPGAYEDTIKSNRCNLVVFRFDMDADTVAARVNISPLFSDSVCLPADVQFLDRSFNADITLVRDPQGNIDTLDGQLFPVLNIGANTFWFTALDTNCNLIDSTELTVYAFNEVLEADFQYEYDSCRGDGQVQFLNRSSGARSYRWDFGDGASSNQEEPQHTYLPGSYTIRLIVEDSICGIQDTLEQSLEVSLLNNETDFVVESDPCDPERNLKAYTALPLGQNGYQEAEWFVDGNLVGTGDTLNFQFTEGGFYQLKLFYRDSICKRTVEKEQELFFYSDAFEVQFPNIFTPNGDGLNERFTIIDLETVAPYLAFANIEIYNRNGQRLFAGDLLQTAWDGRYEGTDVAQAVYFYVLHYEDICGTKKEQNGFLHLQR
jgi:gliding motility-associated-like protein